jgi:pyruvate/2-oxoglutarate dehydrogenase complex dihydrolipoamide dehydrogenase (E3) component
MNDLTNKTHYDAAVIGSGQGGTPLAHHLAEQGLKTALIEQEYVGGTCVNEGCTPTKTMIASARVAHLADRAGDYGVKTGDTRVKLSEVRKRKRNIVKDFRKGNLRRIEEEQNLELIRGTASFVGPYEIKVTGEARDEGGLEADKIFIDTGTRPSAPPIEGLAEVDYLDSTSIMELGETPEKLLIIGGGYIGVEFGQMFRRFGSKVTIIQRSPQLLTHEDRDIAEEVASILEEDGIAIELNSEVRKVEEKDGRGTLVTAEKNGENIVIEGSHLLVAAGRRPNTDKLNLETTKVQIDDRGYIEVNEKLETDQENIWALGDVKGGPAFTHISYDDFRVIRDNLFEDGSASVEDRPVPYTVFMDPQLGRIGLTEKEARKKDYNIDVAKMPMSRVARALEVDETRGVMKAVVDGDTGQILGAAVLGLEGGEIASAIQLAMMGDLTYRDLREGIFAHPTLAESLNNLFAGIDR